MEKNIYVWDGINTQLEEFNSIEEAKEFIKSDFCDSEDGIHPDIESVFILQRVINTSVCDDSQQIIFKPADYRPKQTVCSFCETKLQPSDYNNPNDFYLSCYSHKMLAQVETEKLFKGNPDYKSWHK